MKVVFLLGLPGSGKGTQAEKIAEEFGLVHVMTSQVIREKMANGVEDDPAINLEEEKKRYFSGELNSPYAVIKWLEDKIKKLHSQNKGIVFDGSPRTLQEAEAVTELVDELYGKDNVIPIEVRISNETARERLSTRRICEKCGRPVIYTRETKDLIDCPYPECGGKLIKRDLDDPKKVEVRLKEFLNLTQPAIDFFAKQGRLQVVDGEKSVEEVFEQIESILK